MSHHLIVSPTKYNYVDYTEDMKDLVKQILKNRIATVDIPKDRYILMLGDQYALNRTWFSADNVRTNIKKLIRRTFIKELENQGFQLDEKKGKLLYKLIIDILEQEKWINYIKLINPILTRNQNEN